MQCNTACVTSTAVSYSMLQVTACNVCVCEALRRWRCIPVPKVHELLSKVLRYSGCNSRKQREAAFWPFHVP